MCFLSVRETHAVLFAHGRERRLEEGQTNSLVTRIHEIILAHLVRTEQHLANAGTAVSKQSFDPDPQGSGIRRDLGSRRAISELLNT